MGSQSKVFAFLFPAWGIDFVLKPNWDGEEGAWAVTNPPQEYNWGGSYVHACTGTDNPQKVKEIILAVTANKKCMDGLLKMGCMECGLASILRHWNYQLFCLFLKW